MNSVIFEMRRSILQKLYVLQEILWDILKKWKMKYLKNRYFL